MIQGNPAAANVRKGSARGKPNNPPHCHQAADCRIIGRPEPDEPLQATAARCKIAKQKPAIRIAIIGPICYSCRSPVSFWSESDFLAADLSAFA